MLSNEIRVLESQVCTFNVRDGVESLINRRFQTEKAIVALDSYMEMGM